MEKISKNPNTEIRIQVKEFKERVSVHIREWFLPESGDGRWLPTKKGIVIPLNKWNEFASVVSNVDTSQVEPEEDVQ